MQLPLKGTAVKKSDALPSKYFRAADLKEPITLTIEYVGMNKIANGDGREQEKPVAYFKGHKSGLVLNGTNWDALTDLFGDDSQDWIGHAIELYPTKTQFGSKTVPAIRVREPAVKVRTKARATAKAQPDDMADETPDLG